MKKCGIAPVAQTEATPQEKRRESHAGWNAARMCTQTEAQKIREGSLGRGGCCPSIPS